MLKELNVDQARFIALLANTAREQRDALLGNVAEDDLGGVTPARGQHNPTAELGVRTTSCRRFSAGGGSAGGNKLAA